MMHPRQINELNFVIESFGIGEAFTTSDAMCIWRYKREITLGRMRSYLRSSPRVRFVSEPHHTGYWERID